MLTEKISNRRSGIVLYGMTPPKLEMAPEHVAEIAARQIERIRGLPIDGLILYDLQDESARTAEPRPFPFLTTWDPYRYSRDYLQALAIPKIIYRSVGKYSDAELRGFLREAAVPNYLTVFVGAASKTQSVSLSLAEAYRLKADSQTDLLLGGVAIPERHLNKGDEHLRVFHKMAQGCRFFISQGVYDLNAAKGFLSDYYYYGREHNIPLVPMIFTLTPCGSAKTLAFMKWLGISIPRWMENELLHAQDILRTSVDYSEQIWRELKHFADEKEIPIGCNVESVAIRRAEVEASIELLHRISA